MDAEKQYIRHSRCFPLFAKVCFGLLLLSAAVFVIGIFSSNFAEFINLHISPVVRAVLGYATCWIPFSLAETVLVTLPVTAVALALFCSKRAVRSKADAKAVFSCLLGGISLMFTLFAFTLGCAYRGNSLADHLGMERKNVTTEELTMTARYLQSKAEEELEQVSFLYGSGSVMPYSYTELSDVLVNDYARISDRYDFIPKLYVGVKGIALSKPMAYTHISGVYTYFTGEANVNLYFPDYTIPYTAAHEMSHQRGIAPEDEANFMAFLVCIQSEDAYVRYSGYQNVYEYVMNALYEADYESFRQVYREADIRIQNEMAAYNRFFKQIEDSVASKVSGAVNDTFLKAQGQESGSKSYGEVVDLAVAYWHQQEAK